MQVEISVAVAARSEIILGLTDAQRRDVADALLARGPEAILTVVYGMEVCEVSCELSDHTLTHHTPTHIIAV